ncbi:MAG: phosphate acyltransferase PlsX [Dehalococcoidia bacterium]
MKIAVDAMGGDFAPQEVVKGAISASREHGVGVILVGPEERLKAELGRHDLSGTNMEIVHTDEYLEEGEHPAFALRKKRNASVILTAKLVRDGKAEAAVSAGPTGGVVASALYVLGAIEGMSRPVIGGAFLGFAPETIVMDLGGNMDCRADQLLDFAVVGTVYAREILDIPNPTVALLSVGTEEGKGNEVINEAYSLFKESDLNFIGNVEGNDIPAGKANVIICDGLVGNILVKYTEALGDTFAGWLRKKVGGRLPEDEIAAITHELAVATNPTEAHGGGPLWAVDGAVCVTHGRSKAAEIARTIGQAKMVVERDMVGTLKKELASIRNKVAG